MISQRCVILRVPSAEAEQSIRDAGVTHLIIPANLKDAHSLLATYGEGFSFSVLKSPDCTTKQVSWMCAFLGTKRVFIDITASFTRMGSPSVGLNTEKYELFIISSSSLYDDFSASNMLEFPHRFAMTFNTTRSIASQLKTAKSYEACVPVFILLTPDFKEHFVSFQEEVSGFSDLIVFWSPTVLKGLKPYEPYVEPVVTIPPVERLVIQAKRAVAIFREPSNSGGHFSGIAVVGQKYEFIELINVGLITFAKILLGGKERYALYEQSNTTFFSGPFTELGE